MHVVVTGATGNVGTALLQALLVDPAVTRITGIARRTPAMRPGRVRWMAADVSEADLVPAFQGADAVVHLAWAIQPSRDRAALRRTNVDGSARVFDAAVRAGVPALVYASSVGAYSEDPKDAPVDETWPTGGTTGSFYAVDKAAVEGILDDVEAANPSLRVVRLRPGLIFSRRAASGVARLFLGALFPRAWRGRTGSPWSRTSRGCGSRPSTPTTSPTRTGGRSMPTSAGPSTSPPTRCSTPASWPRRSAPAGCRCRRPPPAPPWT